MIFEADKDSLESVFQDAMTAFGKHIAKAHFGEEHMDWGLSGGEGWGGDFAFDFRFENGEREATFQVQIVAIRDMELELQGCAECGSEYSAFEPECPNCGAANEGEGQCVECARSYGPDYYGPCEH